MVSWLSRCSDSAGDYAAGRPAFWHGNVRRRNNGARALPRLVLATPRVRAARKRRRPHCDSDLRHS